MAYEIQNKPEVPNPTEGNKDNPYANYSRGFTSSFEAIAESNTTDLVIPLSASCYPVPPSTVAFDGFEFETENLIPSEDIPSSFDPENNVVEFFVYDTQRNLISRNYNFTNWSITDNTDPTTPTGSYVSEGVQINNPPSTTQPTNRIALDPPTDLYLAGFESGELYALYNFINYELGSSVDNLFYIAEISGDRTELKLKSNSISAQDIASGYATLKNKTVNADYFDEFYINLLNNKYEIAVNCLLEEETDSEGNLQPVILIKLYVPLPTKYQKGTELYVATKVGETEAYRVEFLEDIEAFIADANYIKGPNVNIELQDLVNNSTQLKSYEELINTNSSSSLDNVLRLLDQTGVTITPNYSYNTFDEFVNFSSAKQRINNFYEKVSQIQAYQADIDTIIGITGSNPSVPEISQSLASLQTNITNIIKNLDGYESYLYYNSSSFAYPKTGSAYPYTLKPTGSTEVLEWLGSDVESSQYYGGYVLSASLYDENNQNWLYYTIPQFIKDNADNDDYITFANMVGQSFDEIWLYTKALSERYNTTNDPDRGLPLGLAAEAIKGLGFETFGNNYNNQGNFIGLAGEDNGEYVPPTGSELITNYIAINSGSITNYWDVGYSWLNYVEQLNEAGFPYAIDKVSKEIYKRLYHNMAYLTKKKGTISGLRQLINVWGIPNTILRINEFGGKNRDNTDDYDLWYKRYSYAYTPVANTYIASSSVKVPWMPLERNYIADNNKYIVPDGIGLRFKTTGFPSSSYGGEFYSQSIAVKKSNGTNNTQFDWGIGLYYEDQPSGSYSGSSFSDYYEYGKLRFFISGSEEDGGTLVSDDIYLPFFNKGWWTVLLQRDFHLSASEATDFNGPFTYTLYAANKEYDGWDGNNIGWEGSASITVHLTASAGSGGYGNAEYGTDTYGEAIGYNSSSLIDSWTNFGVTDWDGVYVGGFISGSNIGTNALNESAKIFSGSFQEFRYYSNDIPQTVFNDFVMNPESIEGNNITGSESSFDIVNFRAPLGNELEYIYAITSSYDDNTYQISSSHPAITGSANTVVTESFRNTNGALTSSYDFIHYSSSVGRTYSKTNVETYLLDQPSIGVRNRVTNKIQIDDNEDYGTVLSRLKSIDQNYLISQSYTEDINLLEVAFSPQDEVNDDIIATYGYGVISDAIADPRFISSSDDYYPRLRTIANDYFKKYTEGDVWDYVRLIKYFDNSLFKAIKSYVPARTSLSTGVVIKQHMLERNRRKPVQITPNTTVAFTPETGSAPGGVSQETGMNSPIEFRNLEITSSISFLAVTGSNGGSPPELNGKVSGSGAGMNIVPVTQSWTGSNETISGSINFTDETQTEFFNGEYSGSYIVAATQSLLYNPYAPSQTLDTSYLMTITSSTGRYSNTLLDDITTYPSFSVSMSIYAYGATENPDQIDVDMDNWADTLPGSGESTRYTKGAIFIKQSQLDFRNFFIHGLILPGIAHYPGGGALVTDEPQAIFGVQVDNTFIDNVPQRIPLPPTASSGLSGVINGDYSVNNLGPYIKVDISGALDPAAQAGGNPADFADSGLAGNLNSSILVSPLFGDSERITQTKFVNNDVPFFQNKWDTPSTSGQRVIRMNGFLNQNISSSFKNNEALITTFYFSNYEALVRKQGKDGKDGFLDDLQASPRGIGTGSALFASTTWTGSYGDSGNYVPMAIMFNTKNYNSQGEIIDNQSTLTNFPSFDFTINRSGSQAKPSTEDYDGLSGSLFRQSLTSVKGVIAAQSDAGRMIGYEYVYTASRGLSGSAQISPFGQYLPTGSQDLQYVNFFPQLPPEKDFYNTPYNALINNATSSVRNTFVEKVEYDNGATIPSNIIPIISRSAEKAEVPDSFYTQLSSINPRYVGSTLQSANYNFYTGEGNYEFLNAISGSDISQSQGNASVPTWSGDVSYGLAAAVDKNPIYFAHFNTSYHNLQLGGTYTFEIDSLILSPQEDILGEKAPQTPVVIKLDGSNDNLIDVSSTFEVGRDVKISYESSKFKGVDYGTLKVGTNKIFQGAIEMPMIGATTTGEFGTGSFQFPQYSVTCSFSIPPWMITDIGADLNNFNKGAANFDGRNVTSSYNTVDRDSNTFGWMATASNALILQGQSLKVSQSIYYSDQSSAVQYYGPALGIINTLNIAVSESNGNSFFGGVPAGGAAYSLGIPAEDGSTNAPTAIKSTIPVNYFYQQFTSSVINPIGFNNQNNPEPFMIKVNDEIEVTVDKEVKSGSADLLGAQETQVFIVTDVTYTDDESPSTWADYDAEYSCSVTAFNQSYVDAPVVYSSLKNKINVYPNPENFNITNGQINGFIIRRRVNADDRVIIYQTPPDLGKQSVTESGGGYIIPQDFSPQQKRNALTLINQLSAKNAYEKDSNRTSES